MRADRLIAKALVGTAAGPIPTASASAAWIDPGGSIYAVEGQNGHEAWIIRHQQIIPKGSLILDEEKQPDARATANSLVREGWVKKLAPDRYEVSLGSLNEVHQHFTSKHPKLQGARVSLSLDEGVVRGYLDRSGRLYPGRPAATEQLSEAASISLGRAITSRDIETLIGIEQDFLRGRSGGLISPGGEHHALDRGDTHTNWLMGNAHRVPREHLTMWPARLGGGVNEDESIESMRRHGWVFKYEKDKYQADETHRETAVKNIQSHVRTTHPGVKNVIVDFHNRQGSPVTERITVGGKARGVRYDPTKVRPSVRDVRRSPLYSQGGE